MLTAERLLELLSYDPETGVFMWREKTSRRRTDVDAGSITDGGYRVICIDWVRYRAHRLAWLYTHGAWPAGEVDHRNGDRLDNRIDNLRDVTGGVNNENRRAVRKDKKCSQFMGVFVRRGKWLAKISVNYKQVYLGQFDTDIAAHQAYVEAKRKLHAGCTL